eukprot:TRINITY_DN11537_c3_g6_i2.p1 TRINITY_DN11537_c3_g6~~TRINITY_DN11537_c3_g6_i2.p1  ORF type:complete len:680 (+),score=154.25 TRINITY_DN11537_c3_g6_i2:180-2042(+)
MAQTDDHGWPLEDCTVYIQTLGADLQGNYSIRMLGFANVTSLADGTILDAVYDELSGVTTAVLAISNPNATDIHLQLANLTSTGVQNVTVMLPGYTHEQADELNPAYIKQLQRYSTIRFLAMTDVDRIFVTNWTQRATPANSPSYSGFCCPTLRQDNSVPWEGVVKIANEAKPKAVWLNLQVTVNDDYFIKLATLLKEQLDPSIIIYTEFGNEMWNGGFPAEWHVGEAANASVQAGDPYHLNYDNCNSDQDWSARLSAYNAAVRIPSLFAKVFGEDQVGRGDNTRVKPLLAGQSSDYRFLQGQLEYLAATQPGAIDWLQSLAMSAYFSLERDLKTNNSLTGDEVLASFNRSLATHVPNIQSQFAAHAMLQVYYGVPELRGYESGPGSFGPQSIPGKVEANQSPKIQDMVERMYLYWHQHGFSTLNYFHAGVQDYNWQFGQWSTHWRSSMPVTPKTQALDAVAKESLPDITLGAPVPITNFTSSTYVGYYSKVPGQPGGANITYMTQNATYNYLFRRPVDAKADKMAVTVYTTTDNANVTSCTLTATVANQGKHDKTLFKLKPTPNKNTWLANTAELTFGPAVNVLRLLAVGTDADCAAFNPKNNRTTLQMQIGAIDVHDV